MDGDGLRPRRGTPRAGRDRPCGVAARSAVLDGELVVVDAAGRADADALAARLAGGAGRPVAFLAFDLIAARRPLAPRRSHS